MVNICISMKHNNLSIWVSWAKI